MYERIRRLFDREHPWFFISPEELDRARRRIAECDWGEELGRSLRCQADALLGWIPQPIEYTWYFCLVEDYRQPSRASQSLYQGHHENMFRKPAVDMESTKILAIAGTLFYDNRYLSKAKEILLHYARYYDCELVKFWDVGMAICSVSLIMTEVYDLIYSQLSSGERSLVEAFFHRAAGAIIENNELWLAEQQGQPYNNHYISHAAGIGCLGLILGRPDLVNYALQNPMGIVILLENGMQTNGMWFESSTNYHFTALWFFVRMAEPFRRADIGFDLYDYVTPSGKTMKSMFDSQINLALPDLTLPQVGDCYGQRLNLPSRKDYEYAYNAYRDKTYAWLLSMGDRFKPLKQGFAGYISLLFGEDLGELQVPESVSQSYPEHGYVLLQANAARGYWKSKDPMVVFFTYDRSSVHCHMDSLSFSLYAKGRTVYPDHEGKSQGHSFSSDIQGELNRTTFNHNCLVVDRKSQSPVPEVLELLEVDLNGPCQRITARDAGHSYAGVHQTRTLILHDDYLLDIFQVKSDEPHTYNLLYHIAAEGSPMQCSLELHPGQHELPEQVGKWLRNCRVGKSDEDVYFGWDFDDFKLRMDIAGEGGTRFMVLDFPENEDFSGNPIPGVFIERHCDSTVFCVLTQIYSDKPSYEICSVAVYDGVIVVLRRADEFSEHKVMPFA